MTGLLRQLRLMPTALRGLLALALLWAASLAPGVMSVRDADGGLTFEFCTGAGVVLMTLDADGRLVPAEDDGSDEGSGAPADHPAAPCAFASAHLAATPHQPLLWTLPDGTAVGPVVALAPAAPAPLRPVLSDPLPRGPPAAV